MKLELDEIARLASGTTEGELIQFDQSVSDPAQEQLREKFQEYERRHAEAAAGLQGLSAG